MKYAMSVKLNKLVPALACGHESYKDLILICPVCSNPVFITNAYYRKDGVLISSHFKHFSGDGIECELKFNKNLKAGNIKKSSIARLQSLKMSHEEFFKILLENCEGLQKLEDEEKARGILAGNGVCEQVEIMTVGDMLALIDKFLYKGSLSAGMNLRITSPAFSSKTNLNKFINNCMIYSFDAIRKTENKSKAHLTFMVKNKIKVYLNCAQNGHGDWKESLRDRLIDLDQQSDYLNMIADFITADNQRMLLQKCIALGLCWMLTYDNQEQWKWFVEKTTEKMKTKIESLKPDIMLEMMIECFALVSVRINWEKVFQSKCVKDSLAIFV